MAGARLIEQLNSLRLTDGEYFAAFLKLDEIRKQNPNAQGNSDEMIGRQLNKSARQVCKMREIAKKADAALLEKIQTGAVSINKAHVPKIEKPLKNKPIGLF